MPNRTENELRDDVDKPSPSYCLVDDVVPSRSEQSSDGDLMHQDQDALGDSMLVAA